MEVRPLGVQKFHAKGQTNGQTYDKADSRFSQFFQRPYEMRQLKSQSIS
jgi:hypothetical protein